VLFLGEELGISVFKDVLYNNPDAQNQHGHMQNTKDLLASIFIIQVRLYLGNLNKKDLFVVCVKR
jgi:hypothetical protein